METLTFYKVSTISSMGMFLLIGYAVTNSMNPLEFLSIDSLLIKIILLWTGIGAVGCFLIAILIGRIPEDAECPVCNRNIRQFFLSLGGAIPCPVHLHNWYHGTCFKREGCKCPERISSHIGSDISHQDIERLIRDFKRD